jgi:alkanesulfonate monooxygenase
MPAELIWELSTERASAGGQAPGAAEVARWVNIARAAEIAGFQALRIPGGPRRPDSWMVAAALGRHVQHIRFIVGLRPGLVLPAIAARRAATLSQILGGRLDLEIAIGRDAHEHRLYGDPMNHDDRFARAAEFLSVLTRTWKGRTAFGSFDHAGENYRIQDGGLDRPPGERPAIYACGGTPGIEAVAAAHADVYYDWADAPKSITERIRRVRSLAGERKRRVRSGCRVHIIAQRAPGTAWPQMQQELLRWGRGRGGTPVQVAPHLWTTGGLYYDEDESTFTSVPGQLAMIAGSYEQVAGCLAELQESGIDSFVLSSGDPLDDLLSIGEQVAPVTRGRGKPRVRGVE